jgi:hypothetical protein
MKWASYPLAALVLLLSCLPCGHEHPIALGASPVPNTQPPALADKREALFFVLHYLKAYPTLENMGLYFGMDVRTVSSYLGRTRAALRAALSELGLYCFNLFKDQEGFDRAFEGVGELVVDCTEVRVQRPNDPDIQHLVYSGKKKTTP